MNRVLIGCCSGWQMHKRRKRCLDTWIKDLHEMVLAPPIADGVLLLGTLQATVPERYGNYLFLPVPNNYQFLVQRTPAFCRWALEQQWWEYLFKTDDDTRLDIQRLLSYDTQGADYIGPEWKPGVGYGSGNGYLLSRRAAAVVSENLTDWEGSEDTRVGEVLAISGIHLRVDNDHFKVLTQPDETPGPENDWVYASPRNREPE